MHGSSQPTAEAVTEAYEPVLRAAGAGAVVLGEQLLTVLDALDGSGSLRRALTDPARSGDDKAGLAQQLLGGRLDGRVVEVVQGLVRVRWAEEDHLLDAIERTAALSLLAAAEADGALEQVEDELFRFDRVLVDQRELRQALTDRRGDPTTRAALVQDLLGAGRVHDVTLRLLVRIAGVPRGRRIGTSLGLLLRLSAERRRLLLAEVTAATPLTAAQVDRLTAILARAYGRPVTVQVGVDPALVGGVRVQVGSEVVDSTVLARLDDVRRRLAG